MTRSENIINHSQPIVQVSSMHQKRVSGFRMNGPEPVGPFGGAFVLNKKEECKVSDAVLNYFRNCSDFSDALRPPPPSYLHHFEFYISAMKMAVVELDSLLES